ncbi:MAG TPA: hypothetical protein VMY18_06940 [Acidobacteriota bacterium]|nr:hypothetical protein [Acidobacteriota bacterium]
MRVIWRISFLAAVLVMCSSSLVQAATQQDPKTLVDGKVSKSGLIAFPEVKFSTVDGRFANFVGVRGGILLNDKFLIGAGGYGLTNVRTLPAMGYGGLVLEYSIQPQSMMHFSVGGLVGGGGVIWESFFVAEPEARLRINVTNWFRLGFGGGFRFISGAGCLNSVLRGPVATLSAEFRF